MVLTHQIQTYVMNERQTASHKSRNRYPCPNLRSPLCQYRFAEEACAMYINASGRSTVVTGFKAQSKQHGAGHNLHNLLSPMCRAYSRHQLSPPVLDWPHRFVHWYIYTAKPRQLGVKHTPYSHTDTQQAYLSHGLMEFEGRIWGLVNRRV